MKRLTLILLTVALALMGLGTASSAWAATPLVTEFCKGETDTAGAGECVITRGLAVNQETGHLYVADQVNARINEFDAWGTFVRSWGWGVSSGTAQFEQCGPQADPPANCQIGIKGSGSGQFATVAGVAVDSEGDVYVFDWKNSRVQKFDAEGNFLLTFGAQVNKTDNTDICTAASGDECGQGVEGTATGFFDPNGPGSYIAVGPGDTIYVGDRGRVQKFTSDGSYFESIPIAKSESVQSLAVDSSGSMYLAFRNPNQPLSSQPDVQKIDADGSLLCTMSATNPRALAVDESDDLYVVNQNSGIEIIRFDSDCKKVDFGPGESVFKPVGVTESTGLTFNSACGVDGRNMFVGSSNVLDSFIALYGPPPDPDICPPPAASPTITGQFATAADSGSAALKAGINPRFWPDTRYFVQYGTAPCSEGGCTEQRPGSPGSLLTKEVLNGDVTTSAVYLEGLKPATTYHYRFVAQSGGGGPVVGEEASFRTLPLGAELNTACPNQAFRTGLSALLPDCRAYELVSPLDKNNGDVAIGSANFAQASSDGARMTFSSSRAFAEPAAAPSVSQYLAERGAGGWASRSISPPRTSIALYGAAGSEEVQYKGFSDDLCSGWVLQNTDLALVPGAPPGLGNIYRRQLCGTDAFELLTATSPPGFGFVRNDSEYAIQFQGASADGSRALLRVNASLAVEPGGPKAPFTCSTRSDAGTISFGWLRDGVPIAGATGATYVPTDEDAGHGLQCRVSVADAEGGSVATSAVFALAPLPAAPAPDPGAENTLFNERGSGLNPPGAPTIAGAPALGETLTCVPGAWKHSPAFSYRWLTNGTPITGATAPTYVPTAAERGTALQCELTGANASGAALTFSKPVLVATQPPLASAAPSISGIPSVGETLTCDPGSWSGAPSFAYQWLTNGTPITGATAPTYFPVAADEGKTIQCRVSATNPEATVSATSSQVVLPTPTATPPSLNSQGDLTGEAAVGETLECSPGTWTGGPAFTYGWMRNGADIPSATAAEYTLTAADLGKAVQCQVTATNAGGATVAIFLPRQVEPRPPAASASARGIFQLYEAYDGGKLRLVSVLPNGSVAKTNSSVGTAQIGEGGVSVESVYGAVSADGSRVFWTATANSQPWPSGGRGSQPGRLYLRLNATEPQSAIGAGQCTEAAKACTILISNATDTRFIAADPAVTRVLYTVGPQDEKLFEAEIEETGGKTVSTPRLITNSVIGVMGASRDAARVYFASSEVLNGSQANSNGDVAQAGKPNLYFYESGKGLTFVGTLGSSDVSRAVDPLGSTPSAIMRFPEKRSSRVTPDGLHVAFTSVASLTGYDNADAISGEPNGEVFLYDATAGAVGRLACVSCNPSGARPRGRKVKEKEGPQPAVWRAAGLPGWEFDRHPSSLLATNGKRLFFNAFDALVPGDSNGRQDVYEWEAPGEGDCTEESPSFSAANSGCLSLITSGQSASDSEVLDATPNGSDVFFTTQSSLLPQDYGLVDVYDARVNGGFPAAPSPPAGCEGEACQGTPSPPQDPTPASAAFNGSGNVRTSAPTRCRKGQRKVRKAGKTRCAPRTKKQKQVRKQEGRAGNDRRNAR